VAYGQSDEHIEDNMRTNGVTREAGAYRMITIGISNKHRMITIGISNKQNDNNRNQQQTE
jgi:hypothetical protein